VEQQYLKQLAARPLTLTEQAEVLRSLHDVPAAQELCKRLGEQLAPLVTTDWIASGPLDEVFAVLDALHYYRPAELSGVQMAAIAKRLMRSEVAVGGPYADKGRLQTRANAYIASCMTWLAAPLPNVDQYLLKKLTALQAAGANTTGWDFEDAWDVLVIQRSLPHAVASAFPQLTLPSKPNDPRVLAMTIRELTAQQAHHQRQRPHNPETSHAVAVATAAQNAYNTLPEPLRAQALSFLSQFIQVDSKYEIRLLARFFADAYHDKATSQLPDQFFVQVGAANIHAWLAYTIYDDFLDDEGEPALLPIANVALRAAATAYKDMLAGHEDFQDLAAQAFATVDAANAWEIAHWRLDVSKHNVMLGTMPDYGDRQRLADRALLHIVGPMAVLAATGSTPADSIWQDVLAGLRHYLIARQLTDDLHDWDKDLRAGHVTYIVAEIIGGLGLPKGVYSFEQLMPHAHEYFWRQALPGLCRTISGHIQQAKASLQAYMSPDNNQLWAFLDTLEDTAQRALQERQQGQEFLQELS
jgi:hypothetical protein